MNAQIEAFFVNTYIKKQYRERLIFELKDVSEKTCRRSYNAFKKFSHWASNYIDSRMIAVVDRKLTEQNVLSYVKNMVSDETCYYMDAYRGENMPLNEAIERTFDYPGASIIVYKDRFAIIKVETVFGAPDKYILVNRR